MKNRYIIEIIHALSCIFSSLFLVFKRIMIYILDNILRVFTNNEIGIP